MSAQVIYPLIVLGSSAVVFFLQLKYGLLFDRGAGENKTYSFSRTQMTWWTVLVLSAFITIVIASGKIPTLLPSTLILLGIGALTSASASITDISDENNAAASAAAGAPVTLSQDMKSDGFILDILSDKTGISIHRLQAFMFNLVIGGWFIYQVCAHLKGISTGSTLVAINSVIPDVENNNLILLGLSSGTYAVLKINENKTATPATGAAADAAANSSTSEIPPVG